MSCSKRNRTALLLVAPVILLLVASPVVVAQSMSKGRGIAHKKLNAAKVGTASPKWNSSSLATKTSNSHKSTQKQSFQLPVLTAAAPAKSAKQATIARSGRTSMSKSSSRGVSRSRQNLSGTARIGSYVPQFNLKFCKTRTHPHFGLVASFGIMADPIS